MAFKIHWKKARVPYLTGLATVILLLIAGTSQAQSITISGTDWTVNPPVITEAGTNYNGTYESSANQILVSMSIPGVLVLGSSATVSIHYEANPLWNANLVLQALRTGPGVNGSICILCTLANGATYQTITDKATSFFTLSTGIGVATNTRNNIPVQLKLSGVSVTLPVDNYNARIVFTISN